MKKEDLVEKEVTLYIKGYRRMYDGEYHTPRKGYVPTINYFFIQGFPEKIGLKRIAEIVGANPGTIQLVFKYYLLNKHRQELKSLKKKLITKRQLEKIDQYILKERRRIITNLLYPLNIKWLRELGDNTMQPWYLLEDCFSQLMTKEEITVIRQRCKIERLLQKKS